MAMEIHSTADRPVGLTRSIDKGAVAAVIGIICMLAIGALLFLTFVDRTSGPLTAVSTNPPVTVPAPKTTSPPGNTTTTPAAPSTR